MSEPIVPRGPVRTKEEVSRQASADFYELTRRYGLGPVQANVGSQDPKSITKLHTGTGHLPAAHTLLNALTIAPDGLFNTLLLYDVVAVPVKAGPVDDLATIAGMLKGATEYVERMRDGQRCHRDTAALAKLFRPLVPAMLAIVQEANGQGRPELKAVAA